MDKTTTEKSEIDYPCQWSYRTIGLDVTVMKASVKQLMGDRVYTYNEKNRKGKFISMELSLTVQTEDEREAVFSGLKDAAVFKMVL